MGVSLGWVVVVLALEAFSWVGVIMRVIMSSIRKGIGFGFFDGNGFCCYFGFLLRCLSQLSLHTMIRFFILNSLTSLHPLLPSPPLPPQCPFPLHKHTYISQPPYL